MSNQDKSLVKFVIPAIGGLAILIGIISCEWSEKAPSSVEVEGSESSEADVSMGHLDLDEPSSEDSEGSEDASSEATSDSFGLEKDLNNSASSTGTSANF